jgi:ABC-type lipoprotein release transport system permease subunit
MTDPALIFMSNFLSILTGLTIGLIASLIFWLACQSYVKIMKEYIKLRAIQTAGKEPFADWWEGQYSLRYPYTAHIERVSMAWSFWVFLAVAVVSAFLLISSGVFPAILTV